MAGQKPGKGGWTLQYQEGYHEYGRSQRSAVRLLVV
jgi:hypothetical protein